MRGDDEKAVSLFADLAQTDPFGYYGIISKIELNDEFTPLKIEKQNNFAGKDNLLNWLIYLEEYQVAKDYLKKIQGRRLKIKDVIKIMPYYQLAQWHEGGIFKFFTLTPENRDYILERFVHIAYPTPYREKVVPVAKKYNIPPALIYAVARQESAFNPTSRSIADAFGMMQILPEKARELKKDARVNYQNFDDLFDVEINMALGAVLLKKLAKRFQNNFIGFVASYNAGSKFVKKWLKNYQREDPVEFIEMIPL